MNKKYDNSRSFLLVTYNLYHKLDTLTGPNKAYCLSVYMSLLKYAWKSSDYKCSVRYSTLIKDTKLSKMTVRRSCSLLSDLGIITIKRLPSANHYSMNIRYLKAERYTTEHTKVYNRTLRGTRENSINRSINTVITNNTNIDKIISKGLGRDTTILELSKLSYEELKNDKKNSYYCSKAITLKEDNDKNKNLVPVEKILRTLKNVGGKKSNAFYRAKVAYNKANGIKPWEK